MNHDDEYDFIIIRSGASGLTSAIVCAHAKLKVLVIEKEPVVGGTTAYSSGVLWIPNNRFIPTFGGKDSGAAASEYLRSLLDELYDAAKMDAYIASGVELLDYLDANTHVRFMGVPVPDYYPDAPGAVIGRAVHVLPYPGRKLGSWLRKLRKPLPAFAAFGTMQVDLVDSARLMNVLKSLDSALFAGKRFASFLYDRARFGRGGYLANGNALVAALLHSALDAGVEVTVETPAVGLLDDRGSVTGVVVRRSNRELRYRARHGVVLATGGFGADARMLAKHVSSDRNLAVQPKGNVGDGLCLGQAAGGRLAGANKDAASLAPVPVQRTRAGAIGKMFPHFGDDRSKPGAIIVTRDGRRFVNESAHYQHIVREMHRLRTGPVYMIADGTFRKRYNIGLAWPKPFPAFAVKRSGYLMSAPTIAELAERISVDAVALEETIGSFNVMARLGHDSDFNRGGDEYNRFFGDPSRGINPNLGPIETPPFHAIELHPGTIGSVLGLDTSPDPEVLGADGASVRGLYAVGLDQNSVFRGVYVGAGACIGPGMVFGYRAARHIIGSVQP